ncbi:peptide MFS transporter [Xanthomonas translucens pv. poae]|nr:peptide MFS transporter [Xanthomonas translucens]UKE63920.1 peptide MFS transporter [Xanthomonas translucens pv. poae]
MSIASERHPVLREASVREDFLGHPKGLYVCFFTGMWERFSFYGMKALLLLFLIEHHRFDDRVGFDVIGAYGGLVYSVPVIGGLLADRYLGVRKAVVFGGILLALGSLGTAIGGNAARIVNGIVVRDEQALAFFYVSLALIVMGAGFLKPNITVVVGALYQRDDPRRDAGFSLFYAGINLGALFASLVCGYLGQALGWRYGFGAAGLGMTVGLAMFLWGQRYLGLKVEAPDNKALAKHTRLGLSLEWSIYLLSALAVLPIATLIWAVANEMFGLGEASLAFVLMLLTVSCVLTWFLWFVLSRCERVERQRMVSLMALIAISMIFFTLYEQTYGSWVTFTDHLMTKDLFPSTVRHQALPVWTGSAFDNVVEFMCFMPWSVVSLLLAPLSFVLASGMSERSRGILASRLIFAAVCLVMLALLVRDVLVLQQNASSLTYLGALFIVVLAPVFSLVWAWLDRFGANPSTPAKSAIGLLLAGLAFVPLAIAARQAGAEGHLASVWWLVLAYFVLELGEMCLSPIGMAAVTQLSVERVVGLMMGTWFLATAFSEVLAAWFGKLSSVELGNSGTLLAGSAEWTAAAQRYESLFWLMVSVGLACALLAFAGAPLIKKGMHGIK